MNKKTIPILYIDFRFHGSSDDLVSKYIIFDDYTYTHLSKKLNDKNVVRFGLGILSDREIKLLRLINNSNHKSIKFTSLKTFNHWYLFSDKLTSNKIPIENICDTDIKYFNILWANKPDSYEIIMNHNKFNHLLSICN
jgi:hypothetical protein